MQRTRGNQEQLKILNPFFGRNTRNDIAAVHLIIAHADEVIQRFTCKLGCRVEEYLRGRQHAGADPVGTVMPN